MLLTVPLRLMFRRLAISLSLLFAFLLVQGHNLIPHHHHEEGSNHSASHHHHHGEHDEDDEDGSTDPFHGTHQAEFGKVLVKAYDLRDLMVKPALILTLAYWLNEPMTNEGPPLIRPPIDRLLYSLLLPHSVPLRAPPAFTHLSA